jgi:hypothetical protein
MIKHVILILICTSTFCFSVMPTFNYSPFLDRIEYSLEKQEYSKVQVYVDELILEVNHIQNEILSTFFPTSFKLYVETAALKTDEEDSYLNFANIFNKVYKNGTHSLLDISIIHNDPAILQYTGLVNNPKLISGLESMSVITINESYAAIKKVSSDSPIIELNIVLSEDILLNVLSSGLDEADLDEFISYIDLNGIVTYLKP